VLPDCEFSLVLAALARLASDSSDTTLRIVRYKGTSSNTLLLLREKNPSKSARLAADRMEDVLMSKKK
jgi:hypothetical protein